MDGIFNVGDYLPDRPLAWLEVVVIFLVLFEYVVWVLVPGSLSLPAVALGFGSTALLLGPVAQTRVGKRIGRWFTEIGPPGRATVIVLFAIAVMVAFSFEATPRTLILEFGLGHLIFTGLVLAAYILRGGRVEGWLPETS
jgi:hypothetical protein